ncbi:hypothetical protein Rsub_03560 [Raphidocelis subcapitata]|uniref:CARDB domain-containing protein n=1 Tax=Raphidocelis subcapitata TaxID=307507 RepID=A0A2V0P070_9CHLO|nr:hypothetical protein Rsub_03560 [Raphidocelis subcapitata]|eukprot:GBF91240.1 hypothetical protein Rsub_03560 [Raphidocelis subcapitata]
MPLTRALVALLVLAAASAALADEPAFQPARIVSRFEAPQEPAGGAGPASLQRANLQNSDPGLHMWSEFFWPVKPEAGKKQKTTIWVINRRDKVIPAGTIVSIWANKTEQPKCGETGDVNYKLPELLPLQTKAIKASWKMPETTGKAKVAIFLDSACTVFNEFYWFNTVIWSTTVVEAGTKYAFLQASKGPDWIESYDFEPKFPPGNSTSKANIRVFNLGTAPTEAGVKMGVYYDLSAIPDNVTSDCTYPGQISVDLPKIAPGKTKVVPVEGIKVPNRNDANYLALYVYMDVTCKLSPAPNPGYFSSGARISSGPGAVLASLQPKGQRYYPVKTTPKTPKANETMTVKVKIANLGDADGVVGRVVIFTTAVDATDAVHYDIGRCDPSLPSLYNGLTFSANTTDLVIKAGKSKTVKITDVPVPATAGWFGLVAVPDADCINEVERSLHWLPVPYNAFEVVAP